MMIKLVVFVFAMLALAACNPGPASQAPASVAVSDAWCRTSPNGARAGGCYVVLTATTDDRLIGGVTPRANDLQIHEMKTEGGVMRMAELAEGLPLPANEAVTLAPGGNHIMLMGLTTPMAEGETVPLTLRFASAPEVTVEAQVRTPAVSGGAHHGDQGGH